MAPIPAPNDEIVSLPEVEEAIGELRQDSDGLRRLEHAAKYWLRQAERDRWRELIAEAMRRALEGDRTWPRRMGFVPFLSGAMRSIANEWRSEARKQRRRVAAVERAGAGEFLKPTPFPLPDEALLEKERQERSAAQVARIEALFLDDEVVLAILEGMKEEMNAEQIRECSDIGETQYKSARRRLRRTVDREFPEGLEL